MLDERMKFSLILKQVKCFSQVICFIEIEQISMDAPTIFLSLTSSKGRKKKKNNRKI